MGAQTPAGRLSVIIPTLNEAERLPRLLDDLGALGLEHEVILADGGSSDATREIGAARACRVITTAPGRGRQLQAGVRAAANPWLLILHADLRIGPGALGEAAGLVAAGDEATFAAWPLRIDGPGFWLRVIEVGAALRWRCLGLPYGDQGLLVARRLYDACGGYPAVPIMEDVALSYALRRSGRPVRFRQPVVADARRYLREGSLRRAVRNLALLGLFLLGVSPERLARWYRPEPPRA